MEHVLKGLTWMLFLPKGTAIMQINKQADGTQFEISLH